MKIFSSRAVLGACLLLAASLPVNAQPPLYHLVGTIPLGGGVKWDYLRIDPARHWLYLAHGNEETVVNLKTRKIVGQLRGLDSSHGVAVDPVSGRIWADSAIKHRAFAFDPSTFAPVLSAKVLADADGMEYDPASKTIFVVGGDAHGLTPINAATGKPDPKIALDGAPESIAADGLGSLYVAIVSRNEVDRVDTSTRQVVAHWPTTGCVHPVGLTVDPARRLVFTSCRGGTMDVLNADTGAVVKTLPIGAGTDQAGFDPVRHRAFSANGDGTLTVVSDDGSSPKVIGTVRTQRGARTMAVDPSTGYVYTVTATITGMIPPEKPGGHPRYRFAPGSLRLLIYAPS